jgi:hypothetical protein
MIGTGKYNVSEGNTEHHDEHKRDGAEEGRGR